MTKQHPNSKPTAKHPWRADVAKAKIDSRAKGAAAEREFAALVLDLAGVKLARNLEQSRSGGHDLEPQGDDPAAVAMRGFAIECKRHQTITPGKLAEFWKQAEEQATLAARMPVLAFRADRQGWAVLVPLRALNANFGAWAGIEWTAQVSVPAFCCLVREQAATAPDGRGDDVSL